MPRISRGRIVPSLNQLAEQETELRACALQIEAWKLLALVSAEFASDPMSQQCFDRRVVARVIAAVADRKELEVKGIFPRVLIGDPAQVREPTWL